MPLGLGTALSAAFGAGTIGVGFGNFASGQPLNSTATKINENMRFMMSPVSDFSGLERNDNGWPGQLQLIQQSWGWRSLSRIFQAASRFLSRDAGFTALADKTADSPAFRLVRYLGLLPG